VILFYKIIKSPYAAVKWAGS